MTINVLLSVIQFILNIFVCCFEYKRGSLSVVLWGVLLIVFAFPHIIYVSFNQMTYPTWVYTQASAFVIFFIMVYIVTRTLFTYCIKNNKNVSYDLRTFLKKSSLNILYYRKISYLYFLAHILMFVVIVLYVYSVSGNILNSSWGVLLNNLPSPYNLGFSFSSFFLFTLPVTCITSSCIIFYIYHKKIFLAIFMLAIILCEALILREKQRLLPFVLPLFLLFCIKNNRLTLVTIMNGILFSILGYSAVVFLSLIRDGTLYNTLGLLSPSWVFTNIVSTICNMGSETGLGKVFYYFIYMGNKFEGFNSGATYLRLIFFWLPTNFSYGLKPKDFAVTMGSAWLGYEQDAFSMHPTFWGDCFANFGWYGVLLAIIWAFAVMYIDRLVVGKQNLFIKLSIATSALQMYVMVARGSVYNACFVFIECMVFIFIVKMIMKNIGLKR